MRKILRENGLSIVLVLFLLLSLAGQIVAGRLDYNEDQRIHGEPAVDLISYLATPHFVEATAENWESEFLQMFAFVLLTAFLFQKGRRNRRTRITKNRWTVIRASQARRKTRRGPCARAA